ncbi:MAG: hypothetical protein AAFO89_07200 [Planctomycetota bacterium]
MTTDQENPMHEPAQPDTPGEATPVQAPIQAPGRFRAFIEQVGLVPPRGQRDPYAHRRGEPRGFTVLWLAYLFLVAGAVYASIGNPAFASAEGYRLASKVLLTMVGIGVLTVWPALRLAQSAAVAGGVSATLRDVAIVLIPMQALIWPQSLITGWGVASVSVVALMLVAWTLIVGALIAIATGPARGHPRALGALSESPHAVSPAARTGAMVAILVLGVSGPLISALLPQSEAELRSTLLMCSPVSAPWELFADRSWMGRRAVTLPEHWKPVLLSLVLGVAAWGVLLVTRRTVRVEDRAGSA